jgi:hypothetical protein
MEPTVETVLARLHWMRSQRIWPNGLRYLWTDAFGVALLVSLRDALGDDRYLDEAEWVVDDVDRVLGRPVGIRIGEEPDRDGQYYHYLAMWLFALAKLGQHRPRYRQKGIDLARAIHPRFVIPGRGVHWKMLEDLSGRYPGVGMGTLDPFHGYVAYRLLDADALREEINDMRILVERSYRQLYVTQDLGLGMLLWTSHFFPSERPGPRRCASDHWRPSMACGSIRPAISLASLPFGRSSLRSPTTASPSACRRSAPMRTASNA